MVISRNRCPIETWATCVVLEYKMSLHTRFSEGFDSVKRAKSVSKNPNTAKWIDTMCTTQTHRNYLRTPLRIEVFFGVDIFILYLVLGNGWRTSSAFPRRAWLNVCSVCSYLRKSDPGPREFQLKEVADKLAETSNPFRFSLFHPRMDIVWKLVLWCPKYINNVNPINLNKPKKTSLSRSLDPASFYSRLWNSRHKSYWVNYPESGGVQTD